MSDAFIYAIQNEDIEQIKQLLLISDPSLDNMPYFMEIMIL